MKEIKNILLLILFVKITTFVIVSFAFFLLPFARNNYYTNFIYPLHDPIVIESAYKTWDAQHYLFLSQKGYQVHADSNAFPPFFPFLIFLGSFITRNSFWSGILLSNIFSFAGLILFYILVKEISSQKVAYASLVALLVFPTSFYFSLIYTESLFFFLCMLFFYFLSKKNIFLAAICAFFLPLTRLIGVVIILPFLTSFLFEYHAHTLYDEVVAIGQTLFSKKTLFLLSPVIGFFAVMGVLYVATGDPFAQFRALQNFVSHHSFFSVFNPLFFIQQLLTFPLAIHGFTNSLLDRIFFFGFLGMLPLIFRRVSLTFFVYAVIFGILPVLSGSFMSYMRYLVVVFPLFICLGKMSLEKKYKQFVFPFLFISMMLQTLFLIMHSLSYWVS